MKTLQLAAGLILFLSLASPAARGGQIGLGAFTSAAVVQDFEGLGIATTNHNSPFVIGNDTYDTDNHVLRSSGKFGPAIGRSGVAIENDPEGSTALIGFIEIVLGTPALRAGMYLGSQFAWAADVRFYDGSNILLGTVGLTGNGRDNGFVAWQADIGSIGRIHVVDLINIMDAFNNPLIIDDFIQEIPEPLTIFNILIGILAVLLARRRRPAGW